MSHRTPIYRDGEILSAEVAAEQSARAKRNMKLPAHASKRRSRRKYSMVNCPSCKDLP